MRFFFEAHNRRGLGHLFRGLNIAASLQARQPSAEILFLTNIAPPRESVDGKFQYLIDQTNGTHWQNLIRFFAPDAIIYDTILPATAPDPGNAHEIFVCRKSRTDKENETFRNPLLNRFALVLIPHSEAEATIDVPGFLADRSVYIGPVVRPQNREVQKRLRKKYRIRPAEFLIVSTAGGGGFADAGRFFDIVFSFHHKLRAHVPNLRHLVIKGPQFQKELIALPEMEIIEFEPELSNLFALASFVIAEGGYNTVNEIRAAQTPAAFLPASRNYDDQFERVSFLKKKGLCEVYNLDSGKDISTQLAGVCRSSGRLSEMRQAYREDEMQTGNDLAAEKILELVHR